MECETKENSQKTLPIQVSSLKYGKNSGKTQIKAWIKWKTRKTENFSIRKCNSVAIVLFYFFWYLILLPFVYFLFFFFAFTSNSCSAVDMFELICARVQACTIFVRGCVFPITSSVEKLKLKKASKIDWNTNKMFSFMFLKSSWLVFCVSVCIWFSYSHFQWWFFKRYFLQKLYGSRWII